MKRRRIITKVYYIIFILSSSYHVMAQGKLSFSVQAGYSRSVNGNDNYSMNAKWPTTSGNNNSSGNSNDLNFYAKATGISKSISVLYDATPHLGLSFIYRTSDFTASESHRSGTTNSLGINLRINLVPNTKHVIPFFVAEFNFINSSTLIQDKATSPLLTTPTQVQPAFTLSGTTNLGLGLDVGIEFKLSKVIGLVTQFGIRAYDVPKTPPAYPAGFVSPSTINGPAFLMGSAGLRFYFNPKKRDF